MDTGRGEIPKILMGPAIIVMVYIGTNFMAARILVRITPYEVNLLLFDDTEESFGDGVITRSSHPLPFLWRAFSPG